MQLLHSCTFAIPPLSHETATDETFPIIVLMPLQHSTQHATLTARRMSRILSCLPQRLYKHTHSNTSSFYPHEKTNVHLHLIAFMHAQHTHMHAHYILLQSRQSEAHRAESSLQSINRGLGAPKHFSCVQFSLINLQLCSCCFYSTSDGTLMKNSYPYLCASLCHTALHHPPLL